MFPQLLVKTNVILKYIHDNCCLIKKDNNCIVIATNKSTTVQHSVLSIQFTYFISIILIITYHLTVELYSSQLVNIGYILSRMIFMHHGKCQWSMTELENCYMNILYRGISRAQGWKRMVCEMLHKNFQLD